MHRLVVGRANEEIMEGSGGSSVRMPPSAHIYIYIYLVRLQVDPFATFFMYIYISCQASGRCQAPTNFARVNPG